MVYFFHAGVLFSIESAKFWPFLTNLGYFVTYTHFFNVFFTDLTIAAVYQVGGGVLGKIRNIYFVVV